MSLPNTSVDWPKYILLTDGELILLTCKSFRSMLHRLNINGDDIKSYGKVDVNTWVCYSFTDQRDLDATLKMRTRFGL